MTLLTVPREPATTLRDTRNTRNSCSSGNSCFVEVVAGRVEIVKSDQKVSIIVKKARKVTKSDQKIHLLVTFVKNALPKAPGASVQAGSFPLEKHINVPLPAGNRKNINVPLPAGNRPLAVGYRIRLFPAGKKSTEKGGKVT